MRRWRGRQEVQQVVESGLVGIALVVISALLTMDAPRPQAGVSPDRGHQTAESIAVDPRRNVESLRVAYVVQYGRAIDSHRALTSRLVDPVTGKPIWWSTGILRLAQGALTSADQGDATRCSNGEECPDPLAP
jgi:hypothetical protein